jgi:hypothetical protein
MDVALILAELRREREQIEGGYYEPRTIGQFDGSRIGSGGLLDQHFLSMADCSAALACMPSTAFV